MGPGRKSQLFKLTLSCLSQAYAGDFLIRLIRRMLEILVINFSCFYMSRKRILNKEFRKVEEGLMHEQGI